MTGDWLRRHMEILASDEMEGRGTGTGGYAKAARYVADRFQELGLEGMGDRGGYEQRVPLLRSRLVPGSLRCRFGKDGRTVELIPDEEFVGAAGFGAAHDEVTAPVVFLGYGIVAPEYGHDDYGQVDVHGQIAVVLSGAPARFETDPRAFYSSPEGKQRLAASRGAVGLITVRTPADLERLPWKVGVTNAGVSAMRWLDPAGLPFDGDSQLVGAVSLAAEGARRFLAFTGHDLDELLARREAGETGGIPLGVTAALARDSEHSHLACANLVGLLRGSDPILREDYLVCSAHLDHLGTREAASGREIFNGAYDNAAGVGTLLCMAATMARAEPRPRRSVLFVAFTAEEKGLRGSSFFVRNPPVAVDRLVANINIDMPYLGFPIADIEAIGADHSTLHEAVVRAAAAVGLEVTSDRLPEQVRFIRSDQFSFVKEGIPGLNLKPGARSSDPATEGKALLSDYLRNHYHQVSDKLDLAYSPAGAKRYLGAAIELGLLVANQDERPRWNERDFFGQRFGRTA